MRHEHSDHPDRVDAEFAEPGRTEAGRTDSCLINALDRLGRSDRGEPDAGFEARVALATRPGVLGSVRVAAPRRSASLRWALSAAACLAAVVGGVWMLRSPVPATAPTGEVRLASIESDIEEFLFIDSLGSGGETGATVVGDTNDDGSVDELFIDVFGLEGGSS